MGKKDRLASVLAGAGAFPLLRALSSLRDDDLPILAYHRVFDFSAELPECAFPFDPELISASSAEFCRQVEYLAAHFSPVTLARVLESTDSGRPLPRRPVVITFDDGHADNYTHAFPVLRRFGVPATIFLSTGYVGGSEPFWFDRVAQLFFRAPAMHVAVPGVEQTLLLGDVTSRRHASRVMLQYLKKIPDGQRHERIAWLEEALSCPAYDEDRLLSGALNWGQVREMAAAGIEFGSHTVTHPVLTRLGEADVERELVESRQAIMQQIGQAVETIAYPVGGADEFDHRVVAAARRAGYRLGVSYVAGTNKVSRLEHFSLRRIHVERYTSFDQFRAMLEFPEFFQ